MRTSEAPNNSYRELEDGELEPPLEPFGFTSNSPTGGDTTTASGGGGNDDPFGFAEADFAAAAEDGAFFLKVEGEAIGMFGKKNFKMEKSRPDSYTHVIITT